MRETAEARDHVVVLSREAEQIVVAERGEQSDRAALVELARFQTKVEADLARLLLEAENYHPVMFDEGMNYIGLGSIMPIRLMVVEEQYESAAAVLAEDGLL